MACACGSSVRPGSTTARTTSGTPSTGKRCSRRSSRRTMAAATVTVTTGTVPTRQISRVDCTPSRKYDRPLSPSASPGWRSHTGSHSNARSAFFRASGSPPASGAKWAASKSDAPAEKRTPSSAARRSAVCSSSAKPLAPSCEVSGIARIIRTSRTEHYDSPCSFESSGGAKLRSARPTAARKLRRSSGVSAWASRAILSIFFASVRWSSPLVSSLEKT